MCLILLSFRAHRDAAVILAGNRDEFHARPSAPPAQIAEQPRIHAGLDLEAGGTWMGRNEHGVLAALTNRRSGAEPPDPRSRGEIVRTLLGFPDAAAAAAWLAQLDMERYRPFNVLVGDTARFFYATSAQAGPPRELQPGFYALSNSTLDDRSWPKVERSHRFLAGHAPLHGEAMVRALQAFLCDPTPPDHLPPADRMDETHGALGAVFINTPGYGTVSASILTAGGVLGSRYYYAEAAAMRAAQQGWARGMFGHEGEATAPPAHGSPFRLLTFDDDAARG